MYVVSKRLVYINFLATIVSCYSVAFCATQETADSVCYLGREGASDFLSSSRSPKTAQKYDVTLIGFVNAADGIGRHPILFKQCLGKEIKINFLSTRDMPPAIEDVQLGLPRLNLSNKQDIGSVAILTDILADKAVSPFQVVPDSKIKIAYTMFESTEIPSAWVTILNTFFDAAVVPNDFLVDVYKQCGVSIPIFVLPLPLELQDFFSLNEKKQRGEPFTFGFSGGFWERKNHMRVLEAFAEEFGNRSDVRLVLHGRFGEEAVIKSLRAAIASKNLSNVDLIVKPLTRNEYLYFFKNLDCYVSLSRGEGLSITPYEALAAAIPCIVTDNTAQKTICSSGAVRAVASDIKVPAFYDSHYQNRCLLPPGEDYTECFLRMNRAFDFSNVITIPSRNMHFGYQFDCSVQDARDAMRDVFRNYGRYVKKARYGREWVKNYVADSLKSKYRNLVKPDALILGKRNLIKDDVLISDSAALYEKYLGIIEN